MSAVRTESSELELQRYLAKVIARSERSECPFIERKFAHDEKWRKYGGEESLRFSNILREEEPNLDALLSQPRVIAVGEPGSGKSTVAREAAVRLASSQSTLPIVVDLRSYRGDLRKLISAETSPTLLSIEFLQSHYIFDGLDEVPQEYVADAIRDLVDLASSESDSKLFVTSRQAFFWNYAFLFGTLFQIFHLLDFDEDDLRTFARDRGLDPQHFVESAERAGIDLEIRNPLNALTISALLIDGQPLSNLRSDNLNTVIQGLLQSRSRTNSLRLRRAVQLLAVSMEIYSRNELTPEEAKRVLTIGLATEEDEAQAMLADLMQSILLQTPNGINFQLRTYGEFLAAFELQAQPLARVQELCSLDDRTPNPSWLNAIALLAELNAEVRRYFIQWYPEWMLSSSPAAFNSDEKTEIVRRLLDKLGKLGQYLFHHPTIQASALAKLITEEARKDLLADLQSDRHVKQANALLVLGLAREKSIIPEALRIAVQVERQDPVRLAALTALTTADSPAILDSLIPVLRRDDLHYATMLECIGMNVAEDDLGRAFPYILSTNTLLTGVYYRFRAIRSKATSRRVLSYLVSHPEVFSDHHAEAYFKPFFKQLVDHCDDELIELLSQMLVVVEDRHEHITGSFGQLLTDPITKSGQTERAATFLLIHCFEAGEVPFRIGQRLGSWMTMRHAEWIVDAEAFGVLRSLATFIPRGEVRTFLSPYTFGLMDEQERNSAEYERQQRERQEQSQTRENLLRDAIIHGSFWEAVNATVKLDDKEWPILSSERKDSFSRDISARLVELDLNASIIYGSGTSWNEPTELQPLLRIVDHYELRVDPDVPLVWTLKAWSGNTIIDHYKRYGLSEDAAKLLVEFGRSAHDRAMPHENFLAFLEQTDFTWPRFNEDLLRFVRDSQSGSLGTRALSILIKQGVAADILAECESSPNDSLRETAFLEQVRRQDRSTIAKALAKLMSSEENLRNSDVGPPYDGPAAWITNITSEWAWKDLVKLRRLSLRNELIYLCDLVTNKLRKINAARLSRTVRAQMKDAPESWRARQSAFAFECEREGLLLTARSLPFSRVLNLLKTSTSLISLKVYVEGKSDAPLYTRLLREMGERELAEKIDVVGGWPSLLDRPVDRWLDGCREVFFIMDGDNGREYGKPTLRLSSVAKTAFQRFQHRPIHLHVLERYGIENYFTQAAMEAVCQQSLAGKWPLPTDRPILDHLTDTAGKRVYSKSANAEVADKMSVSDVEGTDLGEILHRICDAARRLRRE